MCNVHSNKDKRKILMTNGSLMKVESIAEYSPFSKIILILDQWFRICHLKKKFTNGTQWVYWHKMDHK